MQLCIQIINVNFTMSNIQSYLKYLLVLCVTTSVFSQINVTANLNVKHIVGDVSTFDRSKFIVIHANQTEKEWDGDNFTADLRNDFLNGYDVYLGRDTGGITWNLNNMSEDPSRPGFASPSEIASKGVNSRNNFQSKTNLHQYENRKNATIAGQLHPFWTGEGQKATQKGWKLANATATGEFMGRYFNEFHGQNGQKKPSYVEVINEPAYESLGGKLNYTGSIKEIADFHVEVADAIRAQDPNLKIGGYTTAFPDFEVGDFQRWNNRWKQFMDIAGEKMDFWSIHLYDFGSIRGGEKELRSGSNVEATFDMMEHYSKLSFNKVKPFVISEYGAQTHDYNNKPWSPYRDWLHIKASSSLLMSFLERPNSIASAINFIICKAEWGYNNDKDIPYSSRLMRKENEPSSYTGKWVYTDMVKFFQLWQNVKGTRVDTTTDNLDIQVNAYVNGSKAYIILNNLNFKTETINLNVFDTKNVAISSVLKRHLTLKGDTPVLEEETLTSVINSVEVGAESTVILEYTFENEITLNETSNETKYYATDYLKSIEANQARTFEINNVSKSSYGEAVLRIGVGREHGKILHPKVKLNNTSIDVPENWRGYNQAQRERFFGVLEIPLPYDVLSTNNTIEIEFPDSGGHISSVTMQVYEFSDNIREVKPSDIPTNNYQIKTIGTTCPDSNNGSISILTVRNLNYKALITSTGYSNNFDFNKELNVEGLAAGIYKIEITIPDFPEYNIEFSLEITKPDNLIVSSKVNKSNRTVTINLSGNDKYFVKVNGLTNTIYENTIELPLDYGFNEISISTNKDCQGVYFEKLFMGKDMLVYPNPAINNVTLSVPKELVGGEISIYAATGNLIKKQNVIAIHNNILVSEIPTGFYFVTVSKHNEIKLQSKLIIQ